MAMGTRMAIAAASADGVAKSSAGPPLSCEMRPKAKKPPTMNQATEATSATTKGEREGLCCKAKINPPIEGRSSLAAVAILRWAGPAPRRARVAGFAALEPVGGEPATSVRSSGFASSSANSEALKSEGLKSEGL